MSKEYDEYLEEHVSNVKKGWDWIKENLYDDGGSNMPDFISVVDQTIAAHDKSKSSQEEYAAYDDWFYRNDKSYDAKEEFNLAWLTHIHKNPHHWQHWLLYNDEPGEGMVALDMTEEYLIEMVCDWWSFSWKSGDLYEIFDWYDEHKYHMILSDLTRDMVEVLLDDIKQKLDDLNG